MVWGAIAIAGLPTAMTEACQYLHETLSRLPQLRRDDLVGVPPNGVYVLFEKGEYGHGGNRIVRVGTRRGANNLAPRVREHLYSQTKTAVFLGSTFVAVF